MNVRLTRKLLRGVLNGRGTIGKALAWSRLDTITDESDTFDDG
jgi:hypothetical protein